MEETKHRIDLGKGFEVDKLYCLWAHLVVIDD